MTPTTIGGEKQAGISGGVNPPVDIALRHGTLSGDWFCADRNGKGLAEVRSRSMSCNCMTRTSQQECRGILEWGRSKTLKYYVPIIDEGCPFFHKRGALNL